jgi:hypothetical protein
MTNRDVIVPSSLTQHFLLTFHYFSRVYPSSVYHAP